MFPITITKIHAEGGIPTAVSFKRTIVKYCVKKCPSQDKTKLKTRSTGDKNKDQAILNICSKLESLSTEGVAIEPPNEDLSPTGPSIIIEPQAQELTIACEGKVEPELFDEPGFNDLTSGFFEHFKYQKEGIRIIFDWTQTGLEHRINVFRKIDYLPLPEDPRTQRDELESVLAPLALIRQANRNAPSQLSEGPRFHTCVSTSQASSRPASSFAALMRASSEMTEVSWADGDAFTTAWQQAVSRASENMAELPEEISTMEAKRLAVQARRG